MPGAKKFGRRKIQHDKDARTKGAANTLSFNSLIKQLETPGSLLDIIHPDQRVFFLNIPEKYLNKTEEDMREILKEKHLYTPSMVVESIRTRFWTEVDRVGLAKESTMSMVNVYAGVMHRGHWEEMLNTAPHILAYVLCKPPEYEATMNSMLALSTRVVHDILNIPVKKPDGTYQDVKLLELKLKAAAMVDLRMKGGYVQRSETKNLNLVDQRVSVGSYSDHFKAIPRDRPANEIAMDIDARLKELEHEAAQMSLPAPIPAEERQVIDVTSTPVGSDGEKETY